MKTPLKIAGTLIFCLLLLTLSNCDKDEDPTPNDLILGTWTVTSLDATITVDNLSYVAYLKNLGFSDSEAQLLAEEFNDMLEESTYGKLEIKKGGTYSATDDPGSIDSGTWELSGDGKKLTMDKGTSDEYVYDVTMLTASKLTLFVNESDFNGSNIDIELEIELTK
jgi:Lipocalin-like domain